MHNLKAAIEEHLTLRKIMISKRNAYSALPAISGSTKPCLLAFRFEIDRLGALYLLLIPYQFNFSI